jgi:hypothetical protein
MSEEKKPSKAQLFLMEHGEKVALSVAGGLVVLYLVMFFGSSGGNPDVTAVNNSSKKIQLESTQLHEDARKAPEFPKSSENTNEFLENWATPAASTPFPAGDWATSLMPRGKAENLAHVEITKKPWALASVQFDSIQASAQGITLVWSSVDPDDPEEKNIAEIDTFVIERKNPDGSKKKLGEVKGETLTWRDEDVKKKTSYEYRVTPLTDNPQYRQINYNGKGGDTGWKTGTSIDIWRITFSNPSPTEKRAYVTIEKDDKQHGKVKVKHFQSVGDKIGWWKEKKTILEKDEFGRETKKETNELTADHIVRVKGKSLDIGFNTGKTLTAIELRNYKITRQECEVKNGTCTLVDRIMIEKYPIKVVVYKDEDGKEVVWKMKDPSSHPKATGIYTCDEHKVAPPK